MLWRSETKVMNVTNPQPIELTSPMSYIGPNGGRLVCDYLYLVINGTVTVATAPWDGRDVPRLVSSVSIEQNDNTVRVAPIGGGGHRLATIAQVDITRYNEHPSVAVGAAQAIDLRLPIALWRPRQRRPHDYSLGMELFKRLLFTPSQLATAATGTAVLSAGSFTCSLECWGHEESTVEHKALDMWSILDFTSTLQLTAQMTGPIQEAYLVSTAVAAAAVAGGGGLITGVNQVRIDQLGISPLLRATALAQYRMANRRGNTSSAAVAGEVYGDPVTEGRVFPVLPIADELMPPWSGLTSKGGPLKIDIDPATAGIQLLYRCAVPRSTTSWRLTNDAFKVRGDMAKVATSNGNSWGASPAEMAYAPLSIPLASPMRRF